MYWKLPIAIAAFYFGSLAACPHVPQHASKHTLLFVHVRTASLFVRTAIVHCWMHLQTVQLHCQHNCHHGQLASVPLPIPCVRKIHSSNRHSRCAQICQAVRNAKRLKYAGVGQRMVHEPMIVTIQPDGSDSWRLEPVVRLIEDGAVSALATCVRHMLSIVAASALPSRSPVHPRIISQQDGQCAQQWWQSHC